jgi:hypothetical protein
LITPSRSRNTAGMGRRDAAGAARFLTGKAGRFSRDEFQASNEADLADLDVPTVYKSLAGDETASGHPRKPHSSLSINGGMKRIGIDTREPGY